MQSLNSPKQLVVSWRRQQPTMMGRKIKMYWQAGRSVPNAGGWKPLRKLAGMQQNVPLHSVHCCRRAKTETEWGCTKLYRELQQDTLLLTIVTNNLQVSKLQITDFISEYLLNTIEYSSVEAELQTKSLLVCSVTYNSQSQEPPCTSSPLNKKLLFSYHQLAVYPVQYLH